MVRRRHESKPEQADSPGGIPNNQLERLEKIKYDRICPKCGGEYRAGMATHRRSCKGTLLEDSKNAQQ
jgi:hypothetical protein